MYHKPHPGYEYHLNLYDLLAHGTDEEKQAAQEEQRRYISGYTLPEGMDMADRMIPGPGGELRLRVYTPAELRRPAPVILDIHGGGWVSGSLEIDNYRCIYLAEHTRCIVVGVEYRLAGEGVHYPAPLMDCYAALHWVAQNAAELGADPARIGLHGTSAGGNLVAGLCLYVRDHGGPPISLASMNCAVFSQRRTLSHYQNAPYSLGEGDVFCTYMGGYDGLPVPYYAQPADCGDLSGFPPAHIVVAEYDPLRDSGLDFARNLLQAGVPTELVMAPRVGHGFCVVDHPLTRWVHDGLCASFRREFAMDVDK